MPHAYHSMCIQKNCLASILDLASLSLVFLLISVQPGPCAYSLDQSLGPVDVVLYLGLANIVQHLPARNLQGLGGFSLSL